MRLIKNCDISYSRTYNAKWDHDNQTWWERRSKLEKTIIMLLIVIGISFCGAVMFSIYRNSGNEITFSRVDINFTLQMIDKFVILQVVYWLHQK